MKANLITKKITLDYTSVAEPLKIEDVAADISEANAYHYQEPDCILVWEHQADWLVKQTGTVAIYTHGFDNRIGDTGTPGGNGRRIHTIYGVEVRYANL